MGDMANYYGEPYPDDIVEYCREGNSCGNVQALRELRAERRRLYRALENVAALSPVVPASLRRPSIPEALERCVAIAKDALSSRPADEQSYAAALAEQVLVRR